MEQALKRATQPNGISCFQFLQAFIFIGFKKSPLHQCHLDKYRVLTALSLVLIWTLIAFN